MTIKQHGGVFGRHPEFGTVDVDGLATVKSLTIQSNEPLLKISDEFSGGVYSNEIFQSGYTCYYDQMGLGSHVFRIGRDPALTVRYDKNIVLADGNLIVPSGNGIDFSATSGTGTSELFDDYEEGTWTPAVSAGISGVGYASQSGVYTKIGNLVTITGQISTNAGTATGDQFTLTGLPFSVGQIGGAFFTYLNTGVAASLWIASGSMFGYKATGGNLSGTDLADAANTIIYFTGQYTAS
jgi:hypothetical protein